MKQRSREFWNWLTAVAGLAMFCVVMSWLAVAWSDAPLATEPQPGNRPAQMQPLMIAEVTPAAQSTQGIASVAMYARLNAEITSGRRHGSKSGVAPEPAMFQVYEGFPDETLRAAETTPLTDGEPFVVDESEIREIAGLDAAPDDHHKDAIHMVGHCCAGAYRSPPIDTPPGVIHHTVSVPEPSPAPLLGLGMALLGLTRWLRNRP